MPSLPRLATATALAVAAHQVAGRILNGWGATAEERHAPVPGDHHLPDSTRPTTMAVTVDAPPEAVWPWLAQMGIDRAGLYTHLWVENGLLRLGVRNADRIVPAWQDLQIGTRVLFMRGTARRPPFGPVVAGFEAPRWMLLNNGPTPDPEGSFGSWQFALRPLPGGRTRLLLRTRGTRGRPLGMKAFDAVLAPAYAYMSIGMLHGIRERAGRPTPAA